MARRRRGPRAGGARPGARRGGSPSFPCGSAGPFASPPPSCCIRRRSRSCERRRDTPTSSSPRRSGSWSSRPPPTAGRASRAPPTTCARSGRRCRPAGCVDPRAEDRRRRRRRRAGRRLRALAARHRHGPARRHDHLLPGQQPLQVQALRSTRCRAPARVDGLRRGGRRASTSARCRATRSSCRSTRRPASSASLTHNIRRLDYPAVASSTCCCCARRTTRRRSTAIRAHEPAAALPPRHRPRRAAEDQAARPATTGCCWPTASYVRDLRRRGPPGPRPAEEGRRRVLQDAPAASSASRASSTTSTATRTCSRAGSPTEYAMWFDLLLPGLRRDRRADPARRHLQPLHHRRPARARRLGPVQRHRGRRPRHPPAQATATRRRCSTRPRSRRPTPTLSNWIRQRSRWIKGYIQTWLVHMRHPLRLLRADRRRARFLSLPADRSAARSSSCSTRSSGRLTTSRAAPAAGRLHRALFPGSLYYIAAVQLFIGNFVFTSTSSSPARCSAATSTLVQVRAARRRSTGA